MLVLAGCSSADTTSAGATTSPAGDPTTDKLAQVLARGILVLFTGPEISGYDAETGKLVAEAVAAVLGLEDDMLAAATLPDESRHRLLGRIAAPG